MKSTSCEAAKLRDLRFSQRQDGGSVAPRNVGILPHYYTGLQPRRWRLESV